MLAQRISFIGGGNMASALVQGLLDAGTATPAHITVSDVRREALADLQARFGIGVTSDNAQACNAELIVLSVKPQVFGTILPELAKHLAADKTTVVSIAAGVPTSLIEASLPSGTRVVRAMPNTPALVGAGATALCAGKHATDADLQLAERLFASVGITVRVPEDAMDAVTALSGSGPAYVFLVTEALIEAGVRVGLSPEASTLLATQTVHGAGKLLAHSKESPVELRRKVTSPGGTTQAGIAKLEALNLRATLHAGVEAARDRGRELGQAAANQPKP